MISESTGDRTRAQLIWQENQGELPLSFTQSQTIATTGSMYDYAVTCDERGIVRAGIAFLHGDCRATDLDLFYRW